MKSHEGHTLPWTQRPEGDDSAEGVAGALLRKVPAPSEPTDAHLARLGARIAERATQKTPAGAGWGWQLGLATLAVASLAILVWVKTTEVTGEPAGTPEPVAARREETPISVGVCSVVDITADAVAQGSARRILLVGPSEARTAGGEAAEVRLESGQLVARTDERWLVVRTPMADVVIAPEAIADVRIHAFQLTVAALQGHATLDWKAPPQRFEVEGGFERLAAGIHPLDEARARAVEGLLSTGATTGSPVCRPASEQAAPAAVSPPVQPRAEAPAPSPQEEPVRTRPAPPARTPVATVTPVAPAPAEPVAPPVEPAPAAVAPQPAMEAVLAAESRLVSATLMRVRAKDGAGALALLDEYEGRFPDGVLKPETALLRIDALLLVGRRGDALAKLDALKIEQTTRARELRVLRGELRAESNRCDAAIGDFTLALSGAAGVLAERALFGRASCRSQEGDSPGARRDLQQYLERFPRGRFAGDARRGLGR